MVSVEERISYLNKIQQIPKIKLFSDLLNGKQCVANIANVDAAYIGFIDSLSNNNEQKFKEFYNDFSRKKPSSESLWINDDFLIFVLISGIVRYKIDRAWIKGAISARTTQKPEYLSINKTFSNILDDNFQSNDNLYEIVIVLQDFLNLAISTEYLDGLYNRISNNINLYSSQNDFLVCLSMKAIDIIIISKGLPDNKEIANMRDFVALFQKRVETTSKGIYILILSAIIVLMLVFLEKHAEFLNSISVVFGLLGVGLLTFIKWVQEKISEFLLSVLGYSKIFKPKKNK
ncbi:hypothetical protein [Bacteroides graminisolvens]|uniref:hypothetical protein n=1 Tax=Bacteroides graminisolvens TaxID=477666 RepID=UPI0023F2081B|nr:hypothetical protein [Bacteroides graminisolvens]